MSKYPTYKLSAAQIRRNKFWEIRDTLASYIHHHKMGHEYTKKEFSDLLLAEGLTSDRALVNQAFSSLFSPFCEERRPVLFFTQDKRIIRTEQIPTYSD